MFGRKKKEREEHPPPVFTDDWGPCKIEGCQGTVLRQTGYCAYHWRERLEQMEAEREQDRVVSEKYKASKEYPEKQAQAEVKGISSHCSNCGTFVPYSDRTVQLKPVGRRPKKPTMLKDKYEMRCPDCAGK
jgi:hypothetical protein